MSFAVFCAVIFLLKAVEGSIEIRLRCPHKSILYKLSSFITPSSSHGEATQCRKDNIAIFNKMCRQKKECYFVPKKKCFHKKLAIVRYKCKGIFNNKTKEFTLFFPTKRNDQQNYLEDFESVERETADYEQMNASSFEGESPYFTTMFIYFEIIWEKYIAYLHEFIRLRDETIKAYGEYKSAINTYICLKERRSRTELVNEWFGNWLEVYREFKDAKALLDVGVTLDTIKSGYEFLKCSEAKATRDIKIDDQTECSFEDDHITSNYTYQTEKLLEN